MLIDIHGDIWTDVTVKRLMGETDVIKRRHLERFKKGNMSGGIFIVWADPPHDKRPKERLAENIRAMSKEIYESRNFLEIVYDADGFRKAVSEEKLAVILGLEGLGAIQDDIEGIYPLYQFGFRHASLTWNEQNELATGSSGDSTRGLTTKGKDVIKIMNDLGMILDVSHANDKTFWDVYEYTDRPFISSHSNSRNLCNVPRNLTDEQIKAIAEKDGLIGINAFQEFISRDPEKRNVDFLINHIEHIAEIAGIDRIALGFDFFEYLENDTTDTFTENPYKRTIGLEDISKADNLIKKLKSRGFSKDHINKISHENFLSFLDRIM